MVSIIKSLLSSTFENTKPEAILLLSFAAAIITGTILLWLPLCHNDSVGLSEAFFTAVSAVCVTGLIVVDTGKDYTVPGQIVILALIQIGGLGVMTFAALAFELLGKRLSISGQAAMTNALVHNELKRGFRNYFRKILYLIGVIELLGAIVLFINFMTAHSPAFAAYSAVFHSVSAFCNAGFSLYSDSLTGFNHNHFLIGTFAALIIIGGIGHPVIFDLIRITRNPKQNNKTFWARLTVHTRITLTTTLVLLVSGTFGLLFTSIPENGFDLSAALFQSVTARTAGFNTINIGKLPLASLIVLVTLMFIGGSPGSCAGGVKTTTFALWITQLFNRIKGRIEVIALDRYIPQPLVRRASTIISLAILWNFAGILFLSITEPGSGLDKLFFEQISAFGTVGLSAGLTPDLSEPGRLWIIATMFIGRTGPLTAVILLIRKKPVIIKYPEGKVMIG